MRIKLTIIAIITAVFIAPSFADNAKTPTSKGYVDTQIATKQDKVPAVDTNTVITTTNTTGEIGEKSIYDASGNYAEQADALVTAADANAAVQNAIDTEFVCIEWAPNTEPVPENCYIWKIRNVSSQRVLPIGYTALEYIESNGNQCINTGISYTTSDTGFAELDSTFTSLHYVGHNAYMQLTKSSDNCLYIGYGTIIKCVPMSDRNRIGQGWDGPTRRSTLYANGELVNSTTWSSTYTSSYAIFGVGTTCNEASGRFYSLKLTKNGTVVRNMFPARRDSDGVLGAYDLISNQFFTNRGSGTFTAGPVLNVYLPSGN